MLLSNSRLCGLLNDGMLFILYKKKKVICTLSIMFYLNSSKEVVVCRYPKVKNYSNGGLTQVDFADVC